MLAHMYLIDDYDQRKKFIIIAQSEGAAKKKFARKFKESYCIKRIKEIEGDVFELPPGQFVEIDYVSKKKLRELYRKKDIKVFLNELFELITG